MAAILEKRTRSLTDGRTASEQRPRVYFQNCSRLVGNPYLITLRQRLPVIRQADDSGLSDKILPKMLKTYCSPIEDLLYMGLQ